MHKESRLVEVISKVGFLCVFKYGHSNSISVGVAVSSVPASTFYPPPHHHLRQVTLGHLNACGWKLENGRTLVVGSSLGLGEVYFESIKEVYLAKFVILTLCFLLLFFLICVNSGSL